MLQINDKVRITRASACYGSSDWNPAGIHGLIISVMPGLEYCYRVLWSNGKANDYTLTDLEPCFSAGDRVYLSHNSGYYSAHEDSRSNPKNVLGTVTERSVDLVYHDYMVLWDNGCENSYNYNDLILESANLIECLHCKQKMMLDTFAHVYNNHPVCLPCRDAHYFKCELDNIYLSNGERVEDHILEVINEIDRTEYVNVSRGGYENNFTGCNRCGQIFRGYDQYCEGCAELYVNCVGCDCEFQHDNLNDDGECTHCRRRHSEQDDTHNPEKRVTRLKSRLTWGVELECMAWDEDDIWSGHSFTTHSDGSISCELGSGVEYVSGILKGDEGLKKVELFIDHVENTHEVDNSCGFHCHVDGSMLLPDEANPADRSHVKRRRRLTHTIYKMESWIYKVVSPSRVDGEGYSLPLGIDDLKTIPCDRYKGLNLQALNKHGTVEFRYHGGTLNYTKIAKWIKLCTQIVEIIPRRKRLPKPRKFKSAGTVRGMVRYLKVLKMDTNDILYFVSRYCHFQGLNYGQVINELKLNTEKVEA